MHPTPLLYLPRRANVAISHHTNVFPSFYDLLQPASAPMNASQLLTPSPGPFPRRLR